MNEALNKQQAAENFRRLVNRYGLQWTAAVPQSAYTEMAKITVVLSERERREALGFQTPGSS